MDEASGRIKHKHQRCFMTPDGRYVIFYGQEQTAKFLGGSVYNSSNVELSSLIKYECQYGNFRFVKEFPEDGVLLTVSEAASLYQPPPNIEEGKRIKHPKVYVKVGSEIRVYPRSDELFKDINPWFYFIVRHRGKFVKDSITYEFSNKEEWNKYNASIR